MRTSEAMDFAWVLEQIEERFTAAVIDHALIGGFAMAALGFLRATGDLDFLVPGLRADDADRILKEVGFETLFRSPNAANYSSDDTRLGSVDLLFAHRPHSLAMLAAARPMTIAGRSVKVVQAADIVGLKLQAAVNDPRRAAVDLADIDRILPSLSDGDLRRAREYFRLFDREDDFEERLSRMKR